MAINYSTLHYNACQYIINKKASKFMYIYLKKATTRNNWHLFDVYVNIWSVIYFSAEYWFNT